jgi:hypothetical protein
MTELHTIHKPLDDERERKDERRAYVRRDHARHAITVPPEVLAQREARRDARERQSVTSLLCGDPPPGFSALDQLRASQPVMLRRQAALFERGSA